MRTFSHLPHPAVLAAMSRKPATPAGPSASYFNPSDKNAGITLSTASNANDKATSGGTGYKGVRTITSQSSGSWYFEMHISVNASLDIGIGVSTTALSMANTNWVGMGATSWGYWSGSGKTWTNGAFNGTYTGFTVDDIVRIAVDIDAGKMWVGKEGTWMNSGDPAAGTGAVFTNIAGTIFPTVTLGTTTDAVVCRMASADHIYAAPSGFSIWG